MSFYSTERTLNAIAKEYCEQSDKHNYAKQKQSEDSTSEPPHRPSHSHIFQSSIFCSWDISRYLLLSSYNWSKGFLINNVVFSLSVSRFDWRSDFVSFNISLLLFFSVDCWWSSFLGCGANMFFLSCIHMCLYNFLNDHSLIIFGLSLLNVSDSRAKTSSYSYVFVNALPLQLWLLLHFAHNTFTLRHITTSLFRVSNLNYPLTIQTNQMQQGSSLPTQAMFHGNRHATNDTQNYEKDHKTKKADHNHTKINSSNNVTESNHPKRKYVSVLHDKWRAHPPLNLSLLH